MGESGSNLNQEKGQPSTSQSQSNDGRAELPFILVIEDSKMDVYLIREALQGAAIHASLRVLTDGHAAIEFLNMVDADENEPCPALIILDMNLPKRNGNEVLNHLRQSSRCRAARVIVVSSSDAARDRASVADLAVASYFKKPSEYTAFMKLGALAKAVLESEPGHW